MAYTILWMDGFDEVQGTASSLPGKYIGSVETNDFDVTASTAAFGYGRSARFWNGQWMSKVLPGSPYSVLFVHKHIRIPLTSSGEKQFLIFRDEANNLAQFEIRVIYDGVSGTYLLRFYRGSTLLGTSSAGIPVALWVSLSIKYVCNSTSGECTVQIEGNTVLTYTGNTQNGPAPNVYRVYFTNNIGTLDVFLDNLVICTGLPSDPILPQCRIYGAVMPTSNFSTSFTPNAGTNWSNVNEIPPNWDTSYNFSNTVGAKDVFVCSPPTVAGAVLAVRVNYRARKDDAGVLQTKAVIRPGSTDHDGSQTHQPYSTYWNFGETWQNNPDTGAAWTPNDLANLKFGYKIHS